MARAQSQYLRIYDNAGVTYQRWQSYYTTPVSWQNQIWTPVAFTAGGFTEGVDGTEADLDVSAPATGVVVAAFEAAFRFAYFVEILTYQFDAAYDNSSPQISQQLISSYIGQVVMCNGTLTRLSLSLGAPVGSVGAQVPPRVLDTELMGSGFRE